MAYPETPAARLRALRQRWDTDRSSRVFLQLAEEYRRQGMPREALPVLEEGLRHHASSIAGQVALGRCRLELGQAEGAAAVLEKVVERDPTQMVAYRTLVDAYIRLGAAVEARDRLSHYSQLNPQDPEIEGLDRQIAGLERVASNRGDVGAAPSDAAITGDLDAPDAPQTAAAVPDAGTESAVVSDELVAAPWPAVSPHPELPASRGWSTATLEPGWIAASPAAGAATDRASEQAAEPSAPRWSSGWEASDSPTQMFSLPEILQEQPLAPPSSAAAEPDEPIAAREPSGSEYETVLFDLREVAPAIADHAAFVRQRAEAGAEPPEPGEERAWYEAPPFRGSESEADLAAQLEEPSISSDSEPLAAEAEHAGDYPAEVFELSDTGDGALAAAAAGWDADGDGSAPRSWSIGESEIVFSLPATPLLRELVDLAAVPWRPLAGPLWSRHADDGGRSAAPTGADIPGLPGTPTLARLYLEQGHADEAEKLFEQVLRREPDNPVALAGLERAQRERSRLSARSLVRGFEAEGGGLSAKQAYVLRRWATLLREAHRRDAT